MLVKAHYDGLWTGDGFFVGADSQPIRCSDDVELLRDVPIEGSQFPIDCKVAPVGTTGTVLFFTTCDNVVAEIELYLPLPGLVFALEYAQHLRLHMTNEEKYPR